MCPKGQRQVGLAASEEFDHLTDSTRNFRASPFSPAFCRSALSTFGSRLDGGVVSKSPAAPRWPRSLTVLVPRLQPRIAGLPLVLAGPLLRRVTATEVTVFMA